MYLGVMEWIDIIMSCNQIAWGFDVSSLSKVGGVQYLKEVSKLHRTQ